MISIHVCMYIAALQVSGRDPKACATSAVRPRLRYARAIGLSVGLGGLRRVVVAAMSSYHSWLRVVLAFALLAVVYGAPIWEELFGFPPRQHYPRNSQPTARTPRAGGKEKYKATCWVINADNYAFPGQSPYPSAPLCPY
ncbi:hypothetical protein QTP88_003689 [Uroleucon formosanum]